MSDPPCSSSSNRSAQCSLRNSIPRKKPFAQSLAWVIPFSSSRRSGRYTSPNWQNLMPLPRFEAALDLLLSEKLLTPTQGDDGGKWYAAAAELHDHGSESRLTVI